MQKILLENTGNYALVDDEDYEMLTGIGKWHENDQGYAVRRDVIDGDKRTVRMHRIIAGTPEGMITDHINHNRLDNRKSNLRICDQKTNMRNKKDQGRGYWFQKQNKNWVVEVNGIHRGCFSNEADAAEFVEMVRNGEIDKKPKEARVRCKHGHSLEDAYHYGKFVLCRKCQSLRSRKYYVRKTQRQMA